MIILPAIDLKDGKCVRLFQGDYATAEQVAEDPVKTAQSFEEQGARWVHLVGLAVSYTHLTLPTKLEV